MHSACIDVTPNENVNDQQDMTREFTKREAADDSLDKSPNGENVSPPKRLVSLDKSGDLARSPKAVFSAQKKTRVETVVSNSLIDQKVTENSERSREDGTSTIINTNAASAQNRKGS